MSSCPAKPIHGYWLVGRTLSFNAFLFVRYLCPIYLLLRMTIPGKQKTRCHLTIAMKKASVSMREKLSNKWAGLHIPDSKVHGTNMAAIWGQQDPGGPRVGPMNLAISEYGITDKNSSTAYIVSYYWIDTWFLDSNRRVGVWSLPWRWHILSIPLTTGRGTSAETCGLDDVFPPDDLGSRPEALC